MRTLSLSILTLLFLSLSGCGGGEEPDTASSETTSVEQPSNTEESSAETPSSETPSTPEVTPAPKTSVAFSAGSILKYIPEDAVAAVIFRPSKAANNPLVKELLKIVDDGNPQAEVANNLENFEQQFGVKPEQVDHVLVIIDQQLLAMAPMLMGQRSRNRFEDFEPASFRRDVDIEETKSSVAEKVVFQPGAPGGLGGQPPMPVVVVQLVAGVDSQKVFESIPSGKTVDIAGGKAVVAPNGGLLFRVNESRLIFAGEDRLESVLSNSTSGTVAAMLQKSEASDFAVALDLAPVKKFLQQMMQRQPNPMLGMMMPMITPLQTLLISADLEAANLLQVSVDTPNAESAEAVQGMMNGYLGMGKSEFEKAKDGIDSELQPMLQQAVDGATISTSKSVVSLTVPRPEKLETLPELLKPMFEKAADAGELIQKRNHMKQLGLAFHNYHDVHNHFPAVDSNGYKDGDGVRGKGLSWRVHLLPFIEQAPLYQKFKFDEPWDSEHNKALILDMPVAFGDNPEGKSAIHVFVGEGLLFNEGKPGIGFRDITDGTSNTILVVTAGDNTADIWTKPGGLEFNAEDPLKALGNIGREILVLMADGSVRNVSKSIDKETFSNLVQPQDGNRIDQF